MASGFEGLDITYGSELPPLDAETAAKSVVVNNIPDEASEEDIIIHFQKRKHGGGDIERLHIIEETTTAVVIFDSDEHARSVLEKPQSLLGSLLELEPYPTTSPKEPPQVFCRISARIEPDACKVSFPVLRELLEKVEKQMTNVKHHEASHYVIVSGSFEEVSRYRELLQGFLVKACPYQVQPRKNEAPTDSSGRSETEATTLEVVPKFMKLLRRMKNEELHEVESRYPVTLAWSEGADKVEIKRRPGCSDSQYNEGVDRFISLYQKFYPEMAQEALDLSGMDDDFIQQAAGRIMEKIPVSIERCQDKWTIYGVKDTIPGAVMQLKEELGVSGGRRGRSGRHWNGQERTMFAQDSHPQSGAQNSREHSSFPLQHVLDHGVQISVLKGDITSQQVDAIVNAANENLEHGGGVAGAIIRKGGFRIQDESRLLVATRGPVPVGGAVYTSAGNLPYKVVIHAVGPRWDVRNAERGILFLRSACVTSLRLAASIGMTSIALPAISSGIFGMPKDLCAKTMFDAVVEFSNSVDCMFSTLHDVKFVNIDDETVAVFKKEFLSRYTSTTIDREGKHPKGDFPGSRVGPTSSNSPKPLSSREADQSAARPSTESPGHAERVNPTGMKEGKDQSNNLKTPGTDVRKGSARDPSSDENNQPKPGFVGEAPNYSKPGGTQESGRQTDLRAPHAGDSKTTAAVNHNEPATDERWKSNGNTTGASPPAPSLAAKNGTKIIGKKGDGKLVHHQGPAGFKNSASGPMNAKSAAGREQEVLSRQKNPRPPPGLMTENSGKPSNIPNGNKLSGQKSNSAELISFSCREKASDSSSQTEIISEGTQRNAETNNKEVGGPKDDAVQALNTPLPVDNELDDTSVAEKHTDGSKAPQKGRKDPNAAPGAGSYETNSENPKDGTKASKTPIPEDDEPNDILVLKTSKDVGESILEEEKKDTNATPAVENYGQDAENSNNGAILGGRSSEHTPPPVDQTEKDHATERAGTERKPIPEDDKDSNTLRLAGKETDTVAASGDNGVREKDLELSQRGSGQVDDTDIGEPPPLVDGNPHETNGDSDHGVPNLGGSLSDPTISQRSGSTDETNQESGQGSEVGAASPSEGPHGTPSGGATSRCPICLEQHKNPVARDCGHKFCKDCFEKDPDAGKGCPGCAYENRQRAVDNQLSASSIKPVQKEPATGPGDFGATKTEDNVHDGTQVPFSTGFIQILNI